MKKNSILFLSVLISVCLRAQKEQRKIENIHKGAPTCVAITFNATKAITGGDDSRANLWNLDDGSKLRSFAAQDNAVTDVKYNNEESLFATSSVNNTIVVWDALSLKPKKILRETAPVLSVDFHPFNNNLVSLSGSGVVQLWDAAAGKVMRDNYVTLDEKAITSGAILFSRSGKYLAVQANNKLYIFNSNAALIKSFPAVKPKFGKRSFDISPDGKLLVFKSGSSQLTLVSIETGAATGTLNLDSKATTFIRFAQNSNAVFYGREDGKIVFLSVKDNRLIKTFEGHTGAVIDAAISDDGNYLVSIGQDMSLKKWEIGALNLKYLQSPSSGAAPKALVSDLKLNDENQNGLIDAGEKVSLEVKIKNAGPTALFDVVAKLSLENVLEGLEVPDAALAGSISPGAEKSVSIPFVASSKITSGSANLEVSIESAGNQLATQSILLQAGSSNNAGISIKGFKFYSPSGIAKKGEPVTMMVTLENITRVIAEHVQVNYIFPPGVTAIDKNKETIASIAPNEQTKVSVQFIVDKNFRGDTAHIKLNISGVEYTNAKDINMGLAINKAINVQQDLTADLQTQSSEQTRGSLTISKADVPSGNLEGGHYYALVIGIDNYQGSWPKLNNAVSDAKSVAQLLQKQYGFTVHSLYNESATRQGIIKELESLVDKLTPSDNLVIFYSGHGDFKESLNRGFWVPVDAMSGSTSNFISNPDLQTFLSSIKTKHTLLISDACFSGDIFRGAEQKNEGPANEKYYNRVNNLISRQALTSGGLEPVMDGGREGHSVFAYYFLKALKDNHQKYIDAEQLFDAIKIPVVNNSNQAPKFSHVKNTGDEGGEFIFVKQ